MTSIHNRVWNIDETKEHKKTLAYSAPGHKKAVTACSVHPDSDYCLFASKDATWSFHNLATRQLLSTIEVPEKVPISYLRQSQHVVMPRSIPMA